MLRAILLLLGIVAFTASQAPNGTSVCDFYSSSATAANGTAAQKAWITQFVVNVFGGNSTVFSGPSVLGVLSAATFNNTRINLVKYFDGTVYSTDGENGQPQAVNWLDDGGVVALENGRFANTNTSNQYMLFSHFSSLFARVFQCSIIGTVNFTSSLQKTSLYEIHKFMSLDPNELGYFIEQVGLAAQSVGLTSAEADGITTNMNAGLNFRCRPESALFPGGVIGPQSLCTNPSCPLAPNYDCSVYDFDNGTSPLPQLVNGAASSSSSSTSTTATPTVSPTSTSAAASSSNKKTVDIAVGVAVPVGVIALVLVGFLSWRHQKRVTALENRLSRVEVGETPVGRIIGSDNGSHSGHDPAMMVSTAHQSLSGSQLNESPLPIYPGGSPDHRPTSTEYYKPGGTSKVTQMKGSSQSPSSANISFLRNSDGTLTRTGFPPQEME